MFDASSFDPWTRHLAQSLGLWATDVAWWKWGSLGLLLLSPWLACRILPYWVDARKLLDSPKGWRSFVLTGRPAWQILGMVGLAFLLPSLGGWWITRTDAGFEAWFGRVDHPDLTGGAFFLQALAVAVPSLTLVYWVYSWVIGRRGRREPMGHFGNASFAPLRAEWGKGPDVVAEMLVHLPTNKEAGWKVKAPRLARDQDAPWLRQLLRWSPGTLTLFHLTWRRCAEHILVFGKSGSGKTKSWFAPILQTCRVPFIFQDVKGQLPLLDRNPQRKVWGLDVRGHASRSGVWNPCEEWDSRHHAELMAALILPDTGKADDWVRPLSRSVLTAILKIRRWESLQAMARFLLEEGIQGVLPKLDKWSQDQLSEDKIRSIVSQELDRGVGKLWLTRRISEITEGKSTLTLEDFIRHGGYVLACEVNELKAPITLFWGLLFQKLEDRPDDCPDRLVLLLDELGRAGAIPSFDEKLSVLRSKGVSIIAAIQGMAYLRRVYGHFAESVMENFGTRVYLLRNMDWSWRELLTRQLGSWTLTKPRGKGQPPEERPVELVPQDRWSYLAEHRVTLALGNYATWWVPTFTDLPPTPLGVRISPEELEDLADWEQPAIGEGVPVESIAQGDDW
jgi:hypothetical protein